MTGESGVNTSEMKKLPPDVERTLTVGREAILSVCCVCSLMMLYDIVFEIKVCQF